MSKDGRLGTCPSQGKVQFSSYGAAQKHARKFAKSSKFERRKKTPMLVPYRCPDCHWWHLGGQLRTKRRKKK